MPLLPPALPLVPLVMLAMLLPCAITVLDDNQQREQPFVGRTADGDLLLQGDTDGRVLLNGIDLLGELRTAYAQLEEGAVQLHAVQRRLQAREAQLPALRARVCLLSLGNSSGELTLAPVQDIPTTGARASRSFRIGGTLYLVVANSHDDMMNYNINSAIYRWDGNRFIHFQYIRTAGAVSWTAFTVDSTPFLVVANRYNGTSYEINSATYRWDGTMFVHHQDIPTLAASGWAAFEAEGAVFLAVANNRVDNSTRLANGLLGSVVYRWNGTSFARIRNEMLESAATGLSAFTMDGQLYLAMTDEMDLVGDRRIDSTVYQWISGPPLGLFQRYQNIPTIGAANVQPFTVGGVQYLAFANHYNGFTHNIDSYIYRYEEGVGFDMMQSLATRGAADWEFFRVNGVAHLAVANQVEDRDGASTPDGNPSYLTTSTVFRWDDGAEAFEPWLEIPTAGASDWETFTINGTQYLVVANSFDGESYNTTSRVYTLSHACQG